MQLGEKAKALADVEKILKIKPDQPKMQRMRAVLLADLGKSDAAIEELQNLHKANPQDSATMLVLGMIYMSVKKYDKAIEVYSGILADHPDDVEAMRGRADSRLNSGRRSEAAADYEQALKLETHDVGILNNYAWLLATAPEEKLRDGQRGSSWRPTPASRPITSRTTSSARWPRPMPRRAISSPRGNGPRRPWRPSPARTPSRRARMN